MTATQLRERTAATLSAVDGRAVREMLPLVLSILPFGVLVGVATGGLSIPPEAAVVNTLVIFSGSAQIAAVNLLEAGVGTVSVLASIVVLQARLLLYGARLEPLFRDQPPLFRWLGPATIIDQTFALATARHTELRDPAHFRRYWTSACGLLAVGWLTAVGTGMALGPVLPASSPLDIAVPATFVGLLVPHLTTRPATGGAIAGAAAAALSSGLPHGLGLLAGAACGGAVGWFLAKRQRRSC